MMYKKRLSASVALLTAAVVLAGCSQSGGGDAGDTGDDSIRIAFLSSYAGLPFYTAMLCGMQDAATDLGVDAQIVDQGTQHGSSVSEQVPLLQAIVQTKPDGLVLVPAEPQALVAPVQQAIDAGVPVITTDETLASPIDIANYRSDNVDGGKQAAQELVELLDGKTGSILVLDNRPGTVVTNKRADGFIEEISKTPGLNILETQYNNDDQNKSSSIVQATLQAHPDLVGIFATAESNVLGAVAVLKALPDAAEAVSFVGYDADAVEIQALRDGQVDALIAQGSYSQGYDAVTTLVQLKQGKITKDDVTYDNVLPGVVITRDNVDDPEIAKFIYPDTCG